MQLFKSISIKIFLLLINFYLNTLNLNAQNKNCLSFGLRYNQTNLFKDIFSVDNYFFNIPPLEGYNLNFKNNIGSEISYTRFNKLTSSLNLNTGILFQQERSDYGNISTIFGKRHFNNLGINMAFEKILKVNEELKIGISVGLVINKSSKKSVLITGGGSSSLTINSNGDTLVNYNQSEFLYFITKPIKLSSRFELNTYFKTGKHLIKFSFFAQIEAFRYNFLEYNFTYNNYISNFFYIPPTTKTENFSMKILGITTGYCF